MAEGGAVVGAALVNRTDGEPPYGPRGHARQPALGLYAALGFADVFETLDVEL